MGARSQSRSEDERGLWRSCRRRSFDDEGPVYPAYNPSFSAYFFSQNSIFLSQQISQQRFSAGLSAQPNGPKSKVPWQNQDFKSPAIATAIARYSCLRKIKLFVSMYNLAVIARYIPI
jgi:hypothetical protein